MRVNENSETYKKLQIAIEALEYLSNPLGGMIKEADAEGYKLEGHAAVALSNDVSFLKNRAKQALDKIND
jgi:hypothetical protein